MINLIGAYIISLFLIGLILKRPSVVQGEQYLRDTPLWLHILGILLALLIFLSAAFDMFSDYFILRLPYFLLDGFTLWVHEAGHVYWSWGGTFLTSFGGTLNEVLFPNCVLFLS